MSFKKLIPALTDNLELRGFKEPLAFQEKILVKIKGGASMFAIAPTGSGKTTSIVLSVIQKLKGKAVEDAPRAVIIVKDKQAALDMESEFSAFIKETDLRVYCVYEEKNIDDQKEAIYSGVDIVIATPKRLSKLYFVNGINLNKLQMFVVDDAEFLFKNNTFTEITRLPESIGKCQYLVFAEKFDNRFEIWQDTFMNTSQIVNSNL
ncbi:MAG: box helicase [Bacteroidetes bacterium]|jgi:superfamily II DNA/RNA helicase|nr:box helicase [Bacteroidota bacterium]